ncbi:hypothetical protein ACIPJS_38555 [Streptomyces sp. NPDC086783]|uniref:hypothetical protein n=1 Tax=Streptomyces sp. NPDC086783 TaxID=3365758 RepID=UPI00380A9226
MNWIGNALLALVAGSVGSLLSVPTSQRLGEAAKARFATRQRLHGTLSAYRQELEYQHDRSVTEQHGYPPEFAELEGQETLAEEVLRGLPDLSKRMRKQLRHDLQLLVGPTMLAFAESRMWVPEAVRANETERGRLELLLRRVNREPDRYSEGHLQRLLSEQNRLPEHDDHYQKALEALDRMACRVMP